MASPPHQNFIAVLGDNQSSCGYCHRDGETSTTFGFWAYKLTCEAYQDLIDRGWRRSGQYLYRMHMETTCCPPYTIRLGANDYTLSKGHKKVVKKMRRFVSGGNIGVGAAAVGDSKDDDADAGGKEQGDDDRLAAESMAIVEPRPAVEAPPVMLDPSLLVKGNSVGMTDADIATSEEVTGTPKVPNKKPRGEPWVKQEKKPRFQRSDLVAEIKAAESAKAADGTGRKFEVKLVPAKFEKETYELYKRYQIKIHQDPPSKLSESGFENFLVKSPLIPIPSKSEVPGYGSYHQKYYIDGALVAVGFIDILPHCVSSVYFIYEPSPEIMKLSMGVYGAIREISYTMELSRYIEGLSYYYLGFYIHTCQKMRYKGQYKPSYLACPVSFEWVPVEKCLQFLDRNSVVRISVILHQEELQQGVEKIIDDPSFFGPKAVAPQTAPDTVPNSEIASLYALKEGTFSLLGRFPECKSKKKEFKWLYSALGKKLISSLIFVL